MIVDCKTCGEEWVSVDPAPACPACGERENVEIADVEEVPPEEYDDDVDEELDTTYEEPN